MKATLTADQVRSVIRLFNQGWGERNIARIIGSTETIVRNILRGKSYRHITGGVRRMNGKRPKEQLEIYK